MHGLSDKFLSDKPFFAQKADELIAFLGDCPLVAHNASFDFGFLNNELQKCGRAAVAMDRMVDTVALARVRHPGAKLSLDALCTRYGIDRSHRVKHGALLDAELLAHLYIELTGGRQIGLGLVDDDGHESGADRHSETHIEISRTYREPRPHTLRERPNLRGTASLYAEIKDALWLELWASFDRRRQVMDIRVSGHQVETGEALQGHVEKRLTVDYRQIFFQGTVIARYIWARAA